jgi:heptosyltransferase I
VRLSAIGDTCHALAVVRNLQDNWPNTRITWIIGKTEARLLADIADVEFIIFDKTKGSRSYLDVRRGLANKHFDVALCMHASMRANLLCRMIPAPVRLGFDKQRARDFQRLFTNRQIPHVAEQHALDAMMGFAKTIGAVATPLRWDIPISDADRDFASRHVGKRALVISPCSSQRSRNFRNWSVENYAEVVDYASRRYGVQVILTGGNTELERRYGVRINTATNADIVNLIGQTNLKQLLAVIAAADVLICPDSGPAHMATAVDTPVIGLYATSNPARTGPYLRPELTVNRYPDAVQRHLGSTPGALRWGQRVRHKDAMNLITIADVCGKIDDVFV